MVIVTTSAGQLAFTNPPTLDGWQVKVESIVRLDEPEGEYTYALVYSGDGSDGRALISDEDASWLIELIRGPQVTRERLVWCGLFRAAFPNAATQHAAASVDEAIEELKRRGLIET